MVDLEREVAVLPVSDVDQAKAFYTRIRFRDDVDFSGADGFRAVRLTTPGSAPTAAPSSCKEVTTRRHRPDQPRPRYPRRPIEDSRLGSRSCVPKGLAGTAKPEAALTGWQVPSRVNRRRAK